MLILQDAIVIIVVLAVVTTIFLTIFSAIWPKHNSRPSKARVTRALKPQSAAEASSDNLPSIVHQRYKSLASQKRLTRSALLVRALLTLDNLLLTSGLRWRSSSLLTLSICASIIMAGLLNATTHLNPFYSFLFSAVLSAFLCIRVLKYLRVRRLRKFQEIFPEALDLIVRSVRAGLPVSEAVKMIAREVSEPVGPCFEEVSANLSIGMPLEAALNLLQRNVPIQEISFFSTSLSIQQQTGGNLSEILANLAIIMRKRIQVEKKIRALSSEARASAYIIGSLPFLVGAIIYILNRTYIEVLLFDEIGQYFLVGAIISIGVGGTVMAKLVRFEI